MRTGQFVEISRDQAVRRARGSQRIQQRQAGGGQEHGLVAVLLRWRCTAEEGCQRAARQLARAPARPAARLMRLPHRQAARYQRVWRGE